MSIPYVKGPIEGLFDPVSKLLRGFLNFDKSEFAPFPGILSQSAVPVILAPNGTIATNGTVTLGTALPTTYSGGAWVFFPASAVSGDATGGLYWTVFSNTTTGVVYAGKQGVATGINAAFTPYIGSTAGGAVTGSNAAYTQTTAADIVLANVTVPGGAMGANGALRCEFDLSALNNANTKTYKNNFGGQALYSSTGLLTSQSNGVALQRVKNRGNVALQKNACPSYGPGGGSLNFTTVNTAIDQAFTVTCQLATATYYIILEGFTVEVLPGN